MKRSCGHASRRAFAGARGLAWPCRPHSHQAPARELCESCRRYPAWLPAHGEYFCLICCCSCTIPLGYRLTASCIGDTTPWPVTAAADKRKLCGLYMLSLTVNGVKINSFAGWLVHAPRTCFRSQRNLRFIGIGNVG